MGKVADTLDHGQRRFPPVAVPIAVVYKFFDDQGNYLAAIITYYAFVAIFPLLLLATSILGFFLQGNPDLQREVLNSTLSQFPIIGEQLGRPEGLQGSVTAIVVGGLAALYGSLGLGQAIQNAMNIAWSVPRNSRPNPILLRLRSLFLLVTAGLTVVAISVLSALVSNTQVLANAGGWLGWLVRIGTVLVVGLVLTLLFRVATARDHPLVAAAPGAFAVAVMWQALQYVGTWYVTHVLAETSAMNQTFGLVLGLIGLIYIASVMGVLGIEINVVLARRLWPRALLTPFTDRVDLTDADRKAYTSYARSMRHKGFERVEVTFDGMDSLPRVRPPGERPEGREAREGRKGRDGQAPGDGRDEPGGQDHLSGTNR